MDPFQYKLFYYKHLKKDAKKKSNRAKKVTFSPEVTIIPVKNETIYNYIINLLSIFYSNADSYTNNHNENENLFS